MALPRSWRWVRRTLNRLHPGMPKKTIRDARRWVEVERARSPADILRGYVAPLVIEHAPSEVLVRTPPLTVEPEVHPSFVRHYIAQTPRSAVFVLRGARIVGEEGYVLSPDGAVFEEFTYDRRGRGTDYDLFYRLRLPPERHVAGWWATIAYPDATELFHFELESLPRLQLLGELEPLLDGIIVPARLRENHSTVLTELGYGPDRRLVLNTSSHLRFDQLVVPSYLAGKNTPPWVSRLFRRLPVSDAGATPPRVYVSRRDARWRHVTNEDEVIAALGHHGVEPCVLSDLTPGEQRSLFAKAELLVAPHGAGLSNLVYAGRGARLLEMFSPHHVDSTYWSLANAFGLAYAYVLGSPRPHQAEKPDFEDMVVDIPKLLRTLALLTGTEA
jgi:hypothetical protein